jgi:hypothetical protein
MNVAKFVKLQAGESIEKEFYICRANYRRWSAGSVLGVLLGLLCYIVPGIILLLYFSFRTLKTTHGYAAITPYRLIYYQINSHPTENAHTLRQINIRDITSVNISTGRNLSGEDFALQVWTPSSLAFEIGAKRSILARAANTLEAGPDAESFVQQLPRLVMERQDLDSVL